MPPQEGLFVRLDTIAEGAVVELFEAALKAVLENVEDPNTQPDAVRSIALTLKFKPNDSRRESDVTVECKTKLAGIRPATTRIAIGRAGGRVAATEFYTQLDAFQQPAERPTVVEGGATPHGS